MKNEFVIECTLDVYQYCHDPKIEGGSMRRSYNREIKIKAKTEAEALISLSNRIKDLLPVSKLKVPLTVDGISKKSPLTMEGSLQNQSPKLPTTLPTLITNAYGLRAYQKSKEKK